jgi:hypothetical protein
MVPRLIDYVNQSILVSIPVLHTDVKCRSYTLKGVELQGLWLQSEELLKELLGDDEGEGTYALAPAFVSFSHIAFIVLSAAPVRKLAGFPASLRNAPPPAQPADSAGHKSTRADTRKDSEPAPKRKRGR